jgi:hypothetical protein
MTKVYVLLFLLAATMVAAPMWWPATAADTGTPALRSWQAKRIAYNYAIKEQRPLYVVTNVRCLSKYRCVARGEEPGYLDFDAGPDVTRTLIERRGYQFWVRDPFSRYWRRWL